MSARPPRADALVFFGATGDLAYKQIFPALQVLSTRGELSMPVIGVAVPEAKRASASRACSSETTLTAAPDWHTR